MKTEKMGDWRRTHYSDNISPELDGQEVLGKVFVIKLPDKDIMLENIWRRMCNLILILWLRTKYEFLRIQKKKLLIHFTLQYITSIIII